MPGLISTAAPNGANATTTTGVTAPASTVAPASNGGNSFSTNPSSYAGAIGNMYQNDLGGAMNYNGTTGSAYWENQAASGVPLSTINAQIQGSTEGQNYAKTGMTDRPVKTVAPTIPVAQATPAQATASTENLAAPQMTVAGNIGNYLDPNSDTNQMLKTKALEAANGAGTLNSSMTDSAISNGIIANAQQMAQNDQNTYAQGASTNANLLTNTANQNAGLSNQVNLANTNASNQASLQGAQILSQQTIAGMNNANQILLTNLNNNNKNILQTSSAAQATYNTFANNMNAIENNTSTDYATKNQQMQTLLTTAQASMADQGNITSVNAGQYFNGLTVAGLAPAAATGSSG